MKHIAILLATLLLYTCPLRADGFWDKVDYDARLSYSLGGTAPVGMPASIRSLSKYTLKANFGIMGTAHYAFTPHWGLQVGLRIGLEGMKSDARVKNYHMAMVRGGESVEGMFTGHVVTNADMWMLSVPVQAACQLGRFRLRLGPCVSWMLSGSFDGQAYDGYIRLGTPVGNKVEIGSDEGTRGTYDFSDDLRHFYIAMTGGADYRISERWGMAVDVNWGLNGIFHSRFNTIEQTLFPIYGALSATFRL